jgi:hypothetical protein
VGIFGRRAARQRLRKATQESLSVPSFSSPLDCTPWVIGGLWPTELSPANAETTTLADYLRVDLQRIASSANEDLRAIARAGGTYPVRRAAEVRVIDEARALAARRVESTMRQLRQMRRHALPENPRPNAGGRSASGNGRADMDKTQVIPAIREMAPPVDMDKTQVIPAVQDGPPPADPDMEIDSVPVAGETADEEPRLQQLLAFVARQEPRLSWAVGEHPDGTTTLVTDLAHGWLPPGIAVPEGVRLLGPLRRGGRVSELLGTTTRAETYSPGDSAKWPTDSPGITPSVQPLDLPPVEDLDWQLGVATHWRDGLPRLVNTLVKAAASGAEIVEQEADLLRVHLDAARYRILGQYPEVDPAQLLNCMLLAATEGRIFDDLISANYHFAWYQKLNGTPVGENAETTSESAS